MVLPLPNVLRKLVPVNTEPLQQRLFVLPSGRRKRDALRLAQLVRLKAELRNFQIRNSTVLTNLDEKRLGLKTRRHGASASRVYDGPLLDYIVYLGENAFSLIRMLRQAFAELIKQGGEGHDLESDY
jgi:hypothetical protein